MAAEGTNPRLCPGPLHSRRVVLRRLRDTMDEVVERYLVGRETGVLVDVGAGSTPYRPLLEPHVGKYRTADLPGEGAELEIDEQGRVPLPDARADVVLSNQVLEHVDDPGAHVAELVRLLRPGGILVLSTHGYWMYHPTPGDFWRWTGPGLRKVLAGGGLEVLETKGVLGRGAAGVQLLQDVVLERLPTWVRGPAAGVFQLAVATADQLDRSDRHDDACVFVTVSTKPESGRPDGDR